MARPAVNQGIESVQKMGSGVFRQGPQMHHLLHQFVRKIQRSLKHGP